MKCAKCGELDSAAVHATTHPANRGRDTHPFVHPLPFPGYETLEVPC